MGPAHGCGIRNDLHRLVKNRNRDLEHRISIFIDRQIHLLIHLHVIIAGAAPFNPRVSFPVFHNQLCGRGDLRSSGAALQRYLHCILPILQQNTVSIFMFHLSSLPLCLFISCCFAYSSASYSACSPVCSAAAGSGFDTETLWSYQVPFVPTSARSNSSSSAGTGISKPYTSSVIPSL